jgi:CRP-like cAMP-binding protein
MCCTSRTGEVKLSVLSKTGREAVIAMLGPGDFFGEGCLAGQPMRMGTATAAAASTILTIEKTEMVRLLHDEPELSDRFLSHVLARNIRIEEDLVDQLFNSSEKRLARALLLLARYGRDDIPVRLDPGAVAGSARRDGWDDAVTGELLHEQVPAARLHRIQRRHHDQEIAAQRRPPRLNHARFIRRRCAKQHTRRRARWIHSKDACPGRRIVLWPPRCAHHPSKEPT